MADKLNTDGPNGKIYGIITRFDKYWDLPFLTFGTMLQSYGVEMIDNAGHLPQVEQQPKVAALIRDFLA